MYVCEFKCSRKLGSANHNKVNVGISKSAVTRIFNKIGRDIGLKYLPHQKIKF